MPKLFMVLLLVLLVTHLVVCSGVSFEVWGPPVYHVGLVRCGLCFWCTVLYSTIVECCTITHQSGVVTGPDVSGDGCESTLFDKCRVPYEPSEFAQRWTVRALSRVGTHVSIQAVSLLIMFSLAHPGFIAALLTAAGYEVAADLLGGDRCR